jgi:hypothetical protein
MAVAVRLEVAAWASVLALWSSICIWDHHERHLAQIPQFRMEYHRIELRL